MDKQTVEEIFKYHPPTESQRVRYEALRPAAKQLALQILRDCPASPERTTAIRKLQEAVMFANASIAINEKSHPPEDRPKGNPELYVDGDGPWNYPMRHSPDAPEDQISLLSQDAAEPVDNPLVQGIPGRLADNENLEFMLKSDEFMSGAIRAIHDTDHSDADAAAVTADKQLREELTAQQALNRKCTEAAQVSREPLVHHIAVVAHTINRAYSEAIGEEPAPEWWDAPKWMTDSILEGVRFALANPDVTPEQMHENWLKGKIADGWTYGPVKDEKFRRHPCVRSYDELPAEQRTKDHLFLAVVRANAPVPGRWSPGTRLTDIFPSGILWGGRP